MEYVSDKVSIAMQSCLIERIVHRLRFKDSDDSLKPIPLAGVVEEYLEKRDRAIPHVVRLNYCPWVTTKPKSARDRREDRWMLTRVQGNTMVHNYWSHKHVVDRLRWTAEEYGIKVERISEAYTSQTCPRCHSRRSLRVLRGFRCLDCGLETHRDAVGVLNMATRCDGYAVRPMVWPMLLRWDGCGWNRNNGMPTQQRIIVDA